MSSSNYLLFLQLSDTNLKETRTLIGLQYDVIIYSIVIMTKIHYAYQSIIQYAVYKINYCKS